jgi:hypothetical protein
VGKKQKKPKIEQTGVVLTADLRTQLAAAAQAAGNSVSAEIRQRLERTFAEDGFDLPTRNLVEKVRSLTTAVKIQTTQTWHAHPAATRVLRRAINVALARIMPGGDPNAIDNAVFAPGELPIVRLVAQGSDDPDEMGIALEAVVHHAGGWSPQSQIEILKNAKVDDNGKR